MVADGHSIHHFLQGFNQLSWIWKLEESLEEWWLFALLWIGYVSFFCQCMVSFITNVVSIVNDFIGQVWNFYTQKGDFAASLTMDLLTRSLMFCGFIGVFSSEVQPVKTVLLNNVTCFENLTTNLLRRISTSVQLYYSLPLGTMLPCNGQLTSSEQCLMFWNLGAQQIKRHLSSGWCESI